MPLAFMAPNSGILTMEISFFTFGERTFIVLCILYVNVLLFK